MSPLPPIIAHRGASHDAPENTLASLALSWEQHADAAEIDIHLTADGRLAVLHDDHTRRIANHSALVNEMTMDELSALDAGSWKGPQFAGQRIPSLEQVLASLPSDKWLFIEIKCGPEALLPLRDILADSPLRPGQVAIHSFDFALCAGIKLLLPALTVTWLAKHRPGSGSLEDDISRTVSRLQDTGLDGLSLHPSWPVDAPIVRALHDASLRLYVWTVNDLSTARQLTSLGVDGLITDRPGWLREQLTA